MSAAKSAMRYRVVRGALPCPRRSGATAQYPSLARASITRQQVAAEDPKPCTINAVFSDARFPQVMVGKTTGTMASIGFIEEAFP
jgi:hypothetical protein